MANEIPQAQHCYREQHIGYRSGAEYPDLISTGGVGSWFPMYQRPPNCRFHRSIAEDEDEPGNSHRDLADLGSPPSGNDPVGKLVNVNGEPNQNPSDERVNDHLGYHCGERGATSRIKNPSPHPNDASIRYHLFFCCTPDPSVSLDAGGELVRSVSVRNDRRSSDPVGALAGDRSNGPIEGDLNKKDRPRLAG